MQGVAEFSLAQLLNSRVFHHSTHSQWFGKRKPTVLALTTVSALTVVVATLSLLSSVRQPKFLRHVTIRQSSVCIACRAPIWEHIHMVPGYQWESFTWILVTNENYSQEPFTWFLFTTIHVLHSFYTCSKQRTRRTVLIRSWSSRFDSCFHYFMISQLINIRFLQA